MIQQFTKLNCLTRPVRRKNNIAPRDHQSDEGWDFHKAFPSAKFATSGAEKSFHSDFESTSFHNAL